MTNANKISQGLALAMSLGMSARYLLLRKPTMTMMARGTAIERIVLGSRSRRTIDICSAGGTSTVVSGLMRASAS